MLFQALDLIRNQRVVTLPLGTSFQAALDVMTKRDFSQIPITDGNGLYLGLLSEHGVVKHLHKNRHNLSVLDDHIDRWYEKAEPVPIDIDIAQALDKLKLRDAVIIVDTQRHPIGVLTHYDIAKFYDQYAYGFMLLEYIERTLRRYIEAVYPDPEARDAAMAKPSPKEGDNAQGTDRRPERYEDLSLRGYVDGVKHNYRLFERYFGVKKSFGGALDSISTIRNDAMHFRNDGLSEEQIQSLEYAAQYLERCEGQFPPQIDEAAIHDDRQEDDFSGWPDEPDLDYDKLGKWLYSRSFHEGKLTPFSVKFADIESGLGEPLPYGAYKTRDWWQYNQWMEHFMFEGDVKWTAAKVDLKGKTVVFEPFEFSPPED